MACGRSRKDFQPTLSDPEDHDQATDVFGEAGATDIEPGSPSLENALFVCLGVAVALLVILGV